MGLELYHFCFQINHANKILISHNIRLSTVLGSKFNLGIQNHRRDLVFPRAVDSTLYAVMKVSSCPTPVATEISP